MMEQDHIQTVTNADSQELYWLREKQIVRYSDGHKRRLMDMDDDELRQAGRYFTRCGWHRSAKQIQAVRDMRKVMEQVTGFNNETPNDGQGASDMNTNELITIMQLEAGAKLYGVQFLENGTKQPNGKTYTYKDTKGLHLTFNDYAVVEARQGYAVVKIVEIGRSVTDLGCSLGQLRHIISRVPTEQHEQLLQQEHNARQKLAMAEVTQRLDTYRKQFGGALDQAQQALGLAAPDTTVAAKDDTIGVIIDGQGNFVRVDTGEVIGNIDATMKAAEKANV